MIFCSTKIPLKSTTNISNTSEMMPTPQNLNKIFMLDKGKGLNKKYFQ